MSEDFPVPGGFAQGSSLAGYRIEAPLGAGGMAVVYRAHDERLNRPVALKIFAPATTADRAARQRFKDESRTAAAVDHPHIIPIYDAAEAGDVLFIAMRLVRGGDLGGLLEREGMLPPARAADIVSQVASALDAAHAAGLVHRDVKPANILLAAPVGESDYVYLSDFGISRQTARSTTLTGTGQFVGTPGYVAPEQTRNAKLDGRADQYALACVACHLLTGAPPFECENSWDLVTAHLYDPPPSVRLRRPELPEAVDRVLARALAKAPEKRYGSCQDFAGALSEALGLVSIRAAVPSGPPAVASTDWAPAGRPADRSRQTTEAGFVPANGSSLLQPAPPGARPSRRPRGSAAERQWGVLRVRKWVLAAVAALVLVAVGVTGLVQATKQTSKPGSGKRLAAAVGPLVNPAQQPPGVSRDINRMVAAGNTIVTTGTQASGGGASHQQFFASQDGGATWRLATMQRPGGARLTAGPAAQWIAGGPRGWLAEGSQAIWTSTNGLSWTLAATHRISPQQPGDSIFAVTGTADGFLAAGKGVTAGRNQAVIWISRDGTTWQRLTAAQLGLTAAGTIQYATSRGNDTLISDGSGVWLSTDGGTSWTQVTVPVDHGAQNAIQGLSFDGSGLIVVRPGNGASGDPGGVAYFSPDGQGWRFAAAIDPAGGWQPQLVKGSEYGFVVAGKTAGQWVAYASTATGASWQPTKSLGSTSSGTMIESATVGARGIVIAVGSAGQHVVFIETRPEP